MFASFRLALALTFLPLAAHAADAVSFTDLNIAATPSVAAAYPTVTSTGDDEILSAKAECCAAVELHTHTTDGGILRMRKVESVALKAGTPTVFAPGGLHVMFIGFKKPLTAGDSLPVTFTFKNAAPQVVTFTAVTPQSLHENADPHKHH